MVQSIAIGRFGNIHFGTIIFSFQHLKVIQISTNWYKHKWWEILSKQPSSAGKLKEVQL